MEMNQQNQREPGIPCPRCGGFIRTTAAELLASAYLRCPHCFLQLMIDRGRSKKALQALAKIEEARMKVENSSHFNR